MCPTGTSVPRNYYDTRRSDMRSAFDVLDVDHDGKISRDDLQTSYGGLLGAATSDDDVIGSMITLADSNKDGFVEYDEFEKVLLQGGNIKNRNIMEDVFKVMDGDGDGKVGVEDLKNYLNYAGFDANDDDVKAMILLGGGDDDKGGVTYEGFLKILAL